MGGHRIITPGRTMKKVAHFVLLPFILSLSGCSGGSEASKPSEGRLVIKGSNTIGEELAPRLIAEYKKAHPAASLDLESKATGYGLAAVMAGQCDIAAASRTPIKEETELAHGRGIELNDYVIGTYSVAVVVNSMPRPWAAPFPL